MNKFQFWTWMTPNKRMDRHPLFVLCLFTGKNGFHIWALVQACLLSCVQLFATPWTVNHQVPLSVGFSQQEYWCMLNRFSHFQLCNSMDCSPPGSSVHSILQAKILGWVAMPSSRGMGCHFLLQGIFPTQGRTCISCFGRRILHHWATWA